VLFDGQRDFLGDQSIKHSKISLSNLRIYVIV